MGVSLNYGDFQNILYTWIVFTETSLISEHSLILVILVQHALIYPKICQNQPLCVSNMFCYVQPEGYTLEEWLPYIIIPPKSIKAKSQRLDFHEQLVTAWTFGTFSVA